MNVGRHENLPQALRNRTIVVSHALPYLGTRQPSDLLLRCKIVEEVLAGAAASSRASITAAAEALSVPDFAMGRGLPALRDELEPYLPEIPPRTAEANVKTLEEFKVYSRMVPKLRPFSTLSEDEFLRAVLEIHRRLGTGANQLRQTPVWTRRDSTGNALLYPDARECRALLGRLHTFIATNAPANPALCAVAGYAALIQIHPFNDGNGRTARTFFNLLLSSELRVRHFVPLQALKAQWPGSYIIKLRRAMHQSDLVPIADYFAALVRISSSLQR